MDYRLCVSCGGTGSVVDHGSHEERPCSLCRKIQYAAWVAERQPATQRFAILDDKGRCCGRKPMIYKKPALHFFCDRCCAEFDPDGEQRENWAWIRDGECFVATSPTADYALRPAPDTAPL